MKKLSIYLIALILVPAILFTSCKPEEPIVPEADPAFTVLTDYLKANNLDVGDIIGDKAAGTFFVTAPAQDIADSYTVLDIRSATAFEDGRIDGAKNIAFANILTEANAAEKPVLIVCYTGQTACFATALLRLSGHADTKALKWGMSGWNDHFVTDDAYWNSVIGSDLAADNSDNWTTDATSTEVFADPDLTETLTDGKALLDSRINTVIADGFKLVTATEVFTNPGNYFINNKFSDTHYLGFGHVTGAYKIDPITLADDIYKGYDSSKDVVTYCYTGQTSAIISAYLRVLGYDAYSLKFGMNGLSHGNTYWETGGVANHWGVNANPADFTFIGTGN